MLQRLLALESFVNQLLFRVAALEARVASLEQSAVQLTGTRGY